MVFLRLFFMIKKKGITYAGRDPIGVRPMFYGQDTLGNWYFASEAKGL